MNLLDFAVWALGTLAVGGTGAGGTWLVAQRRAQAATSKRERQLLDKLGEVSRELERRRVGDPPRQAPALTDSQRMEIPFVSKELCEARHEAVDSQFHEVRTVITDLKRGHETMQDGLHQQALAFARLEAHAQAPGAKRGGSAVPR